MYYYFFRNKIVVFSIRVNLLLNRGFVELTAEQIEFYLANPTASVEEVRKCELNHPYIPPAPSIVQLQDDAKRQLKEAYLAKMSRYSDLQVAMAVTSHLALTTLTIADKCPYTLSQANNIIEGFNSLSKDAKSIYDRYYTLFGEQMTQEAIDSALEAGLAEMEAL